MPRCVRMLQMKLSPWIKYTLAGKNEIPGLLLPAPPLPPFGAQNQLLCFAGRCGTRSDFAIKQRLHARERGAELQAVHLLALCSAVLLSLELTAYLVFVCCVVCLCCRFGCM